MSLTVLKVLGGLAAATTVVGGAYLLTNSIPFGLNENTSNSENWTVDLQQHNGSGWIKVIALKKSSKNDVETVSLDLECSIVPSPNPPNKQLDLQEYQAILETKLGIMKTLSDKELKDVEKQRQNFVKYCKKNGVNEGETGEGKIRKKITLSTEPKQGDDSKLQLKDFNKLFEEIADNVSET